MKAIDLLAKIEESTDQSWSMYRDKKTPVPPQEYDKSSGVATVNSFDIENQLRAPDGPDLLISDGDPWASVASDGFNEFIAGIAEV